MRGIISAAGYLPYWRLERSAIVFGGESQGTRSRVERLQCFANLLSITLRSKHREHGGRDADSFPPQHFHRVKPLGKARKRGSDERAGFIVERLKCHGDADIVPPQERKQEQEKLKQ